MVEKLPKVLNVGNILNQKINRIQFTGAFYQAYGYVQDRGVWFFWGTSGSGKSVKVMLTAKEMAECLNEKIFHNLCEEETDDDEYIERVGITKMAELKDKYFARSYSYEQMCKYLDKANSPKIVIIDSATYCFKDKAQYFEFVKKYRRRKLILITGHANGSKPRTELEIDIMYNAKMKVFCNGYLASCKGRKIGPNGGTFIIWDEGYQKIQGTKTTTS